MAAAARARSSSDGPNVCALVNPCVGAVRMAVNADSAPAMAQASDDIREENTPDIRAVSGAAAAARRARPYRLRRRNTAIAMTKIGPRISIAEYDGVTSSAPMRNVGRNDGWGYSVPAPAFWLMANASAARSCPTPSVA